MSAASFVSVCWPAMVMVTAKRNAAVRNFFERLVGRDFNETGFNMMETFRGFESILLFYRETVVVGLELDLRSTWREYMGEPGSAGAGIV